MANAGLVEQSARRAMADALDVCDGCRLCTERCVTFPTLFEMLDTIGGATGESSGAGRAGRMTPDQQDRVAASCFQCGECVDACPSAPQVDVPRVLVDTMAVRAAAGVRPVREATAARLLAGRPRLVARLMAPSPGSWRRRLVASVTGLSAARLVRRPARRRCSALLPADDGRAAVVVVPTCVVEHQQPSLGTDLAQVLAAHGVTCALGSARCCGASALHAGDRDRLRSTVGRLLDDLAPAARRGAAIVVAQPACARTIRTAAQLVDHPDAALVAGQVHDATEYAYGLAGVSPPPVAGPAGIGSPWGLRQANDDVVATMVGAMVDALAGTGEAAIAFDSLLEADELARRLGRPVAHPVTLLADRHLRRVTGS